VLKSTVAALVAPPRDRLKESGSMGFVGTSIVAAHPMVAVVVLRAVHEAMVVAVVSSGFLD
jgi:hypothetical protein